MNNLNIKNYVIAWKKIIFHSNKNHFQHNLFFKNNVSWIILLFIADATYNNEDISYEKLCAILSQDVTSRSTIYRILNDFLSEHLITKEHSTTDTRVKYFYLSNKGKDMFESLVKIELDVFSARK